MTVFRTHCISVDLLTAVLLVCFEMYTITHVYVCSDIVYVGSKGSGTTQNMF